MKKILIAVGLIIVISVSVFAAVYFTKDNSAPSENSDFETEIIVDGWLKITDIYEYNGKLAVVAENVSDTAIEYALLSVTDINNVFTFNISALLSGTKTVLLCNENAGYDPDAVYTGWNAENVLKFETAPSMNEDKFDVSVANGSISVKNISGSDITSDIYIYYKEKINGLLNGNITHRICISGLKADAKTFVKAEKLNENNCQIIFIQYDDKKV